MPLGLGIGRLVFWGLAIGGWVLLIALTVAAGARSDIIIAGGDPGPSPLHYLYITAEVILLALIVVWLVRRARRLPMPASADSPSH